VDAARSSARSRGVFRFHFSPGAPLVPDVVCGRPRRSYLIHFPISLKYVPFETRYPPEWVHDPAAEGGGEMVEDPVPVAATWGAMEALVKAKLVREIGVANFASGLLTDLLASANSVPPAVLQIESHPYLTQARRVETRYSVSFRFTRCSVSFRFVSFRHARTSRSRVGVRGVVFLFFAFTRPASDWRRPVELPRPPA
jgi:hypothetical protein